MFFQSQSRPFSFSALDKSEIYILIAVFVLLMVILVWSGAKYAHDIRRHKQRREERREEWKRRMQATVNGAGRDKQI